jgi:hypothetical protein
MTDEQPEQTTPEQAMPEPTEEQQPAAPPVQPPQPASYYGSPTQDSTERPEGAFDRLIPAKNPPALIGYYLGVFSLIPCFALMLGPAALVCGILGLKAVKKTPGLPGKGHAWTALILGGITTLANYGFLIFAIVAAAMNKS